MHRHPTVKAGLYSLAAAGTLFAFGGVAPPAAAAAPTAAVALPQDCDVIGGQPGGEHAPGGHDDHFGGDAAPSEEGEMDHSQMGDGEMDHSQMGDGEMDHGQMGEGEMDHGSGDAMDHGADAEGGSGHDSHGESAAPAGPADGTRNVVLGGFAGVNAVALGAAGLLRRRTSTRRERHVSARSTARPARRSTEGDEQ
jgi:hypothetical protein